MSPGCKHCYANVRAQLSGKHCWGPGASRLPQLPKYWKQLKKWDAEAAAGTVGKDGKRWLVFMGDMCDIFDDEGLPEERKRMWEQVSGCPHLTFLFLTKRPQNVVRYLPPDWGSGYENCWLGVTVEDREHGYPRIDLLRATPAKVRFLSCEPLLEDISDIDLANIDWVIVGGESGAGSREFRVEWARAIRDRCAADGIAFFAKQMGQTATEDGDLLPVVRPSGGKKKDTHRKSVESFPPDLRVQQWPDSEAESADEPSKLPQPVWPDNPVEETIPPLHIGEFRNVMLWLGSWNGVPGPMGCMAQSAYASLNGMIQYVDEREAGNAA